jgi:hypothetical protein
MNSISLKNLALAYLPLIAVSNIFQKKLDEQLEVIHDKIPNGSMTSHDFDDLFCSFGYLHIKQSCYNQ